MDIKTIKSATIGNNIIINMRTYTIKNDIKLNDENPDDIYWEISMKDNTTFIVDNNTIAKILVIKYNDIDEFTAKWYLLNGRVACVIPNTKKSLYLDEYLLPKHDKLLHTHKDNNKLNYRINNIELVSQSIINSKAKQNKQQINSSISEITNASDTTTQKQLYNPNEYQIIDTQPGYTILQNIATPEYKIVEFIAYNDKTTKFIIDIKMLKNVFQYKWSYHSATGYIYHYTSKDYNPDTNKRNMLYLHSFLYFSANPTIAKKEGYSIHHKNINKLDNRLENLDYVSQSTQNAIRENPTRISKQQAIQDIKKDLPKLMTYYPAKGNFGEYFEIDIKPRKDTPNPFTRTRKKTTKSVDCTLIDKVCHAVLIRYQIIHSLITESKIPISNFCLEGKQFTGLIEFKKHHEQLINTLYNKYEPSEPILESNYTITTFEKYIKDKSKRKANSGSFKPQSSNEN